MLPEELNVDTIISPQYSKHTYKWQLIRDSLDGEPAIKRQNEKYLPMPAAMQQVGAVAPSTKGTIYSDDPDYHANASYSAYKSRSRFPEITEATLRGILGLIQRNPSAYHNLQVNYLLENATKDGKSLADTELYLDSEVMANGRAGVLADVDDDDGGLLKILHYTAEDLLNWRTKGSGEDLRIESILLRDNFYPKEFWEPVPEGDRHLLLLIDEGVYKVGEYHDNKLVKERIPSFMGKTLTYIPFVFLGAIDLTPDIDTAPLWALSNLSKAMYQMSADLRNAQFMTCNPMLTISGITKDQAPAAIGSTLALILESDLAKAYYPSTDTSALEHMRMSMRDMEREAVRMGANLLGNESSQAESGEAIRLKQSMTAATIASVVSTVGKGVERLVNMIQDWSRKETTFTVKVNKEFSSFQMTANEQIALVQSWQSGVLSTETTLENFRRAGMLQEGEDPLAEIDRIKTEAEEELKKEMGIVSDTDQDLPEGSQANPAVQKANDNEEVEEREQNV